MTRDHINELQLATDVEAVFRALEDIEVESLMGGDQLSTAASVNDVINSLGEVARNHGIRFPREFTLLLKQFLYFDRYVQLLDPGANLFDDERVLVGF